MRVLTRREFLASLSAIGVASACRTEPSAGRAEMAGASGTPAPRLDAVGIQLYTVRREMQRDLPGTLARIAEIGYREVEFAGYFGRAPAQIRSELAAHGLTAPSTHLPYELIASGWDRALDDAAAAGHQYVTVPWLPAEARRTLDGWRTVADRFNQAGEQATARGLRFAYHNHDFELARIDGVVPFDVLLERTDPRHVGFQMDVYWLVKGGGNPLEYLRRHPARFSMLHIKDSAGPPDHAMVDVGDGVIDFGAILRLDRAQRGAVKHVFVEHDQPTDAMAFARKSFHHLNTLEL